MRKLTNANLTDTNVTCNSKIVMSSCHQTKGLKRLKMSLFTRNYPSYSVESNFNLERRQLLVYKIGMLNFWVGSF